MSAIEVTRWIRGYDRVSGKLLVEYRLSNSWTLERLQGLFGIPGDNPMYDCYPLTKDTVEALEKDVGHSLVDDDREFFLEADAE